MENDINNTYNDKINDAEKAGNKDLLDSIIKDRDQKIEKVRTEYSKTETEIKAELVSIKDNEYKNLKRSIDDNDMFKYYIEDKNGVFTNLDGTTNISEYINKNALYCIKFPQEVLPGPPSPLGRVNNYFLETGVAGYLLVPKNEKSNSPVYANYRQFNDVKVRLIIEVLVLILSIITAAAILIYILKKKKSELEFTESLLQHYVRIPMDLRAVIFLFSGLTLLFCIDSFHFFSQQFDMTHVLMLTFTTLYICFLILEIENIIKIVKVRDILYRQWKECLVYKLARLVKDGFILKGVLFKIVLIILLTVFYGGFTGLLISASMNEAADAGIVAIICTVLYIFIIPVYILTKLRLFNKIVLGTEEIVSGNFNNTIENNGKGILSKLAGNINNMREGFKKSLESQVKSERLKSELITNVSHDLKTPLTSIINYVNLLKRGDVSEEEMQNYIAVLDQKSQRMKTLIEDLFEATKLSSGTVELNKERLDVAALLHQALAEFDEKIKESTLSFKVNAEKHTIFAALDGKKTWRVFENLISNILKYSQPNTRVYIDLEEKQNKVVITMKNISAYELDFDAEEIFERFKRGDKSRNTEGSGLGLAIAKSIVELHGGRLFIEIDGDLFKAVIEFV